MKSKNPFFLAAVLAGLCLGSATAHAAVLNTAATVACDKHKDKDKHKEKTKTDALVACDCDKDKDKEKSKPVALVACGCDKDKDKDKTKTA